MDNHFIPVEYANPSSAWHMEIMSADDADSVVRTVQDFVVLWTPKELAQVPEGCALDRFSRPEDVKRYAEKIAYDASPSRRRPGLPRRVLGAFFAVAANRITELER